MMAIRRCFMTLATASIFLIGILFLASVPPATAETLNYKVFVHMTKAQATPIADVEGHVLTVGDREGSVVFENGEWAGTKGSMFMMELKDSDRLKDM